MTESPITAYPNMPLDGVISLMENYAVKRVPVVDGGDNLLGIITRVDILKALRVVLEQNRKPDAAVSNRTDDDAIRREIIDKISRQPWAPQSSIRVSVDNGVVDIYGTILNEDFRKALITLIEETIASNHVRDHLVYLEPISGLYLAPDEDKRKKD